MISINLWVIVQLFFLIIILFLGIEFILRNQGVTPLKTETTKSKITPEDEFYKEHPVLGFVNQEGQYHLNINDGDFTFSARHDSEGHRITSEFSPGNEKINKQAEVWIFGCSFIYGWLVEDDETFSWLLQEKLNDWNVTNYAVSGYSTLQSYLQFKEVLQNKKPPEVVMIFYGSGIHDRRNVFSRKRKKMFTRLERISPFKVPCGRIGDNGNLSIKYDRIKYTGLPFNTYSALMNYLDEKLNRYLDNRLNEFEVSKKILTKFHQLCRENNSTFIVGGIVQDNKTKEMLNYCEEKGIETVDIALDRRPEHVHDYDFHPSPLAHQKYADRIARFLNENNLMTK